MVHGYLVDVTVFKFDNTAL